VSAFPTIRAATADELAGWDQRTVAVADGDVHQSLAWAEHRRTSGWRVHHLADGDGGLALALGRARPVLGGGRLYLPRGPVNDGHPEVERADRLAAIAGWARDAGYDEIVADAEVPSATGYPALLAARGFQQVEELDASRHRMSVRIPAGVPEAEIRAGIAGRARQRFHMAERRGYRVVRHDVLAGSDAGDGFETPPSGTNVSSMAAFERFHALLSDTGVRRGFGIGPVGPAVAWWNAALAAGHLVLLEAFAPDGTLLAGAIFLRHGRRLTYGHSADVAELRHDWPGAVQLLLWRAMQLVIREGRQELDLAGVDVAGARHEPKPGDEMYGLYEFKRAYGAIWVEQSGAHARILRPGRHRLGALASGVAGRARAARRRDVAR
jgi:Acetyltransferase (GNAT) domain